MCENTSLIDCFFFYPVENLSWKAHEVPVNRLIYSSLTQRFFIVLLATRQTKLGLLKFERLPLTVHH